MAEVTNGAASEKKHLETRKAAQGTLIRDRIAVEV
jgi:hypothetical protein